MAFDMGCKKTACFPVFKTRVLDSNYILGFSGYKETNVLALPHNSVPDELEGVTNGTLANIIRQLSSLSRHAEEMFGNLSIEAEGVAVRSSNLQAKIDKLAVRVTQLDSTVEEGKVGKILFWRKGQM